MSVVSLVVEGATPALLSLLLPELRRQKLRVTFGVSGQMVVQDFQQWRTAVDDGHELANASLHGYEYGGQLLNWTNRMVEQDLHMTQQFLENEFESVPKTALLPGLSTLCADGDYVKVVRVAFEHVVSMVVGTNQPPYAFKNLLSVDGEAWLEAFEGEALGWTIVRVPASISFYLLEKLSESSVEVAPIGEIASMLQKVAQ